MAGPRPVHGAVLASPPMGRHDADEFEDEPPSKSELKRQSRDLQDLGDELVALPPAELDALALPDEVRDAVIEGRRITAHGARVRQRLYIGKLLRHIDVEPLRAALARRADTDRERIRREHVIEAWRERLLADDAAAWTELGARVAPGDLQQLRALARQARAERDATRPPAAARQLFRRLRELLHDPGK
jgi:ribosome-associated protein